MPAEITFISTMDHNVAHTKDNRVELYQELSSPGSTDHVRMQGLVVVQLSGDATAIVAKVEHATRDPGGAQANWAPAEETNFTGDLSAGVPPRFYTEPATGFWRVTIVSITGGTCQVSIVGERT